MTDPYLLKQTLPYRDKDFPFITLHIRPLGKQIIHLHWHEEWEIIYLQKGKAEFYIGAENVTAEAGDLLFVNKGLIHTGFSIQYSQVEYCAIIFHPNLVRSSMADAHHLQITNPYTEGKSIFPLHVSRKDNHYYTILDIVKNLISENLVQTKGYQLAIHSLLNLLMVHLVRYHPKQAETIQTHEFDQEMNERFKQLISYIESNYSEKITVQQAAAIVNFSTYHFCRTFKKITGKTLVEYVNHYRINIAERLLQESNVPVIQIAYDVGFSSINYFSQIYKQYKCMSPSKYRKQSGGIAVPG